jgi:hypothetical protein
MNIPVRVRTHELDQLQTMLPKVHGDLVAAERGEDATEIDRIYDEHVRGVEATYPEGPQFAAYVSMPVDDWQTALKHMTRLYRTEGRPRVNYLQTKLVGRLQDRTDELQ